MSELAACNRCVNECRCGWIYGLQRTISRQVRTVNRLRLLADGYRDRWLKHGGASEFLKFVDSNFDGPTREAVALTVSKYSDVTERFSQWWWSDWAVTLMLPNDSSMPQIDCEWKRLMSKTRQEERNRIATALREKIKIPTLTANDRAVLECIADDIELGDL